MSSIIDRINADYAANQAAHLAGEKLAALAKRRRRSNKGCALAPRSLSAMGRLLPAFSFPVPYRQIWRWLIAPGQTNYRSLSSVRFFSPTGDFCSWAGA